jgi:hypothetical protein
VCVLDPKIQKNYKNSINVVKMRAQFKYKFMENIKKIKAKIKVKIKAKIKVKIKAKIKAKIKQINTKIKSKR